MRRDNHARILVVEHHTLTTESDGGSTFSTAFSTSTSAFPTSLPSTTTSTGIGTNPSNTLGTPIGTGSNTVTGGPLTTAIVVTLTSGGSTIISTVFSTLPTSGSGSATSTGTSTPTSTALGSNQTPGGSINAQAQAICAGDGLDASAIGVIATIIWALGVGLLLWLLFAIIRPRFRQLYGLREWFVAPELRPQPLNNSLWAFLFPHTPLVPDVPSDVSDAGQSAEGDAQLFPTDEELTQRTLWVSFMLVLGWSILALIGALPLYLVDTPCLANVGPQPEYGGRSSTLYDLSLLRLLRMLDKGEAITPSLSKRLIVDGVDRAPNAYIRLIILVVILLVVAILPAMWKLFKEFTALANYRRRWIEVKCEGMEIGWLSAHKAPGFTGWGESRFKDFLVKNGLSSSLTSGGTNQPERRNKKIEPTATSREAANSDEKAKPQLEVTGLFTIGDTTELAPLIQERDEVLNNLEVAETLYINSFQVTTPDHIPTSGPNRRSIVGVDEHGNNTGLKPKISHPRALAGYYKPARRARNRQPQNQSQVTVSYLAPSQYYKLNGVQGVSGGRMPSDASAEDPPTPDIRPTRGSLSLSQTFKQRVIGSRFQEVNRDSTFLGKLPLGSHVQVNDRGELGPISQPPSVDHGPNHAANDPDLLGDADEWSIISATALDRVSEDGQHPEGDHTVSGDHRDAIPMRPLKNRDSTATPDVAPPHLRPQGNQPSVRPMTGLNHDDLGIIYGDIRFWRSRLKAINAEIAETQGARYQEIANGQRVKGWLFVGRGIRFFPGIEMIEGRSKEDVRYDEIQYGGGVWSTVGFWAVAVVIGLFLGIGITAAAGLALAGAPDVAHYLPFLNILAERDDIGSGIATALVPALLVTSFTVIAIAGINYAAKFSGHVSVSTVRLTSFKATFLILAIIVGFWLVGAGSLLFSMHAIDKGISQSENVADGSIAIAVFLLVLAISVAIIAPALLMLQPFHLWRMLKLQRNSVTPRQRFRGMYPRSYNPTFAMGCCVLAVIFVCAFSLIFPLISIPVVILLFLSLVAHRYLIGYVNSRTAQTGGLMQLWLLRRFGTLLALQPLLLGLILLSRELWVLGGVTLGAALVIVIAVESYTEWKTRLPGPDTLSPINRDSLQTFGRAARQEGRTLQDNSSSGSPSSPNHGRSHGSIASVLEMMSVTLAVMPSRATRRGPVPLQTDALDDLVSTEKAARTHPDAPPHLPPLAFTDHAEEMSGILYAPELIAPAPVIWLPNDPAGIARAEAYDLQRYHSLATTLDVRSTNDVLPKRKTPTKARQ